MYACVCECKKRSSPRGAENKGAEAEGAPRVFYTSTHRTAAVLFLFSFRFLASKYYASSAAAAPSGPLPFCGKNVYVCTRHTRARPGGFPTRPSDRNPNGRRSTYEELIPKYLTFVYRDRHRCGRSPQQHHHHHHRVVSSRREFTMWSGGGGGGVYGEKGSCGDDPNVTIVPNDNGTSYCVIGHGEARRILYVCEKITVSQPRRFGTEASQGLERILRVY